MKLLYLPLLIILYLVPAVSVADPVDKVVQLLRQGNINGLSGLFAANIEIAILGDENVYSRAQAQVMLNKFFSQNKPGSVKILHKINSNPNYLFGVLIVATNNGTYRVAFTLKQTGGNFAMIELRIEKDRVK